MLLKSKSIFFLSFFFQDSTIKIIFGTDRTAYFSWQQTSSKQDNVVGINATVATNLGLCEGDIVSLVICSHSPHLRRVEMSPLSSDDLEMIVILFASVT